MAALPALAAANSAFFADLCRDHWCDDPRYPLADYENGECICKRHPCWELNGRKYTCNDNPEHPFLHYIYTDGAFQCMCSSLPHYDPPYLVQKICPANGCDTPEHPVLDYDPDEGHCFCRHHPCENINGTKYSCTDPGYPVLKYREDENGNGICDCHALLEEPAAPKKKALRGAAGEDDSGKCVMSPHQQPAPETGDPTPLPRAAPSVVM